MRDIWSQHGRVALERDFWIAVMKGAARPRGADPGRRDQRLRSGEETTSDLASIAKRERVTLHEREGAHRGVSELAKRQFIHLGPHQSRPHGKRRATQIFRALKMVQFKAAAALLALARQAEAHRDLMITGRTHNVPAQPTTFGKRLAMFGQGIAGRFHPRRGAARAAIQCEDSKARWAPSSTS